MKKKAVFLTHPLLLRAKIDGGVQLCSQEFHHIIDLCDDLEVTDYYVRFTENVPQRIKMRLGFENYNMYDVSKDSPGLLKYVEENNIEIVFINMSSCVRFAKPLQDKFGGKIKVILLSHGNHSGDFLHLITKPLKKENFLTKKLNKVRLGNLIATEALFRVKYLDAVVTISDTEKQIENWFGAKKVVFMPRRLHTAFVKHQPDINRIGFVGRLDHPPNFQGVSILLDEMEKHAPKNLKLRLVGAPPKKGNIIAGKYKCVEYTGELSDKELENEIRTWSFFINPVWWYSTGASTKLAKAISWGIPIATTTAGMRGYYWKTGDMLVANTPKKMMDTILNEISSLGRISYWREQTRIIAENGLTDKELVDLLKSTYNDI